MMISFTHFNSLAALVSEFDNETKCQQALAEHRWGNNVVCPYCGQHHCKITKSGRYYCKSCGNKFSVKVGTIFENTKISLRKWFMALYLMSSHKKGISSCQLSRDIHVTQKTAWFMLQKIRTLFTQDTTKLLEGDIEVDEVYIGGKEYYKHQCKKVKGTQGRSTKTKSPVFGLLQRSKVKGKKSHQRKGQEDYSYVYAFKVQSGSAGDLLPWINYLCNKGSHVYTDEMNSYAHLNSLGYNHQKVNHKLGEFVNGEVYTNNIEGFWAHLRRMITGTYHKISKKHLQFYIDEECFRWNNRWKTQSSIFNTMFNNCLKVVTYKMIMSSCK